MNFYGNKNYKADETVEYACNIGQPKHFYVCEAKCELFHIETSSFFLIAVFTNPTSPGRVLFKR